MSASRLVVLDASVGVKWFKPEPGSSEARRLLEQSIAGEVSLLAPVHFAHEVLSAVRRHFGAEYVMRAWGDLRSSEVRLLHLTDEVVREAAEQCSLLGCDFYDSLGPACASLLGATLASADAKAHGAYPDLLLVE